MPQPKSAYANYKQYSVRYDLEQHGFQYGYASNKKVIENGAITEITYRDEEFGLKDYETVSISSSQRDDATCLTVTYQNGPSAQKELGIQFVLNETGISCTFLCRGDLDIHVAGRINWGEDMVNETFAMNQNRQGQDLRSAHGPASSIIDNCLFDRRSDSLIEISGCYKTRIQFDWAIAAYRFYLNTEGNDYTKGFHIRVYEHVYADRFNIHYNPINPHTTFSGPPVGWMTWYSVQFDASEATVLENARWQAKQLKDFGANTIWVDWEWYHNDFSGSGKPDTDIFHPDPSKYPNGLKYIADEIKKLGLTPAIWIGATNDSIENEFIQDHPDTILVKKRQWCGQYFFDPTHPLYLTKFIPRVFQQILNWGYQALKWDCLPTTIQLYDQYHDRFYDPQLSTEQALLEVMKAARNVVGTDFYMLYCAGLSNRDFNIASAFFDAARIGGDIFKWEDFIGQCIARVMKLYAMHNVVFLNDPDNVILRPKFNTYDQALSRLSFVSLLGLPITLGDNLPDLPEDRIELLRRGIPSLTTHPMDLRVNTHDYRVVKANLVINKPFEQWNVVDVFNLLEDNIETSVDLFTELHLSVEEGPYLVYDYWTKEFIGEIENSFSVTLRPYASKVFAIRKKLGRPQILSTSRHISQGAYDLTEIVWDESLQTLSGVSKVVSNDPYDLVFYVPNGLRLFTESNWTSSPDVKKISANIWQMRIIPETTGELAWSAAFTPNFSG